MSVGSPSAAAVPRRKISPKPTSLAYATPSLRVIQRLTVVEIRCVDRVAGLPQFVGKREEPPRLPLRMVKQEHRRHHGTVANLGREAGSTAEGPPAPARPAAGALPRRGVRA